MMSKQKTYIAIDLKSFYASVECKERNRDPLTTNLVVADKSRTEKTICLDRHIHIGYETRTNGILSQLGYVDINELSLRRIKKYNTK